MDTVFHNQRSRSVSSLLIHTGPSGQDRGYLDDRVWTLSSPGFSLQARAAGVSRLKHVTDSSVTSLQRDLLSGALTTLARAARTSTVPALHARTPPGLCSLCSLAQQHPSAASCAFFPGQLLLFPQKSQGRALCWGALEHDTLPHNSLKFQCSPVLSNDESETS